MKVLLVGGGGREHALAWAIARSPLVESLQAAPGNPGIGRHARCVDLAAADLEGVAAFAGREGIDLTVVGPEAPLVAGLADRFAERGLAVFGPSAAAARLEGSKAYAKALMAAHGVPTARFRTFEDAGEARRYCRELGAPLVVKADGLAAGKGVVVCSTLAEADAALADIMERRVFGTAGARVVVEEFLRGEEASFHVVTSGDEVVTLASAQDHKSVFDGDRGPNTGGMGAYSPFARIDAAVEAEILHTIVRPTLAALRADGTPYRGALYVGLMLTEAGPRVIEFNCRFGDPECQAILVRARGDLVPLLHAAATGRPLGEGPGWADDASVCVTLASGGYPGAYRTGLPIRGLEAAERRAGVRVFHAGTAERDGRLVTSGGRVLGVTATGASLEAAVAAAYAAVGEVGFEGMHHRTDIGRRRQPAMEAR